MFVVVVGGDCGCGGTTELVYSAWGSIIYKYFFKNLKNLEQTWNESGTNLVRTCKEPVKELIRFCAKYLYRFVYSS